MERFKIEVSCTAGGTPHTHRLTVMPGAGAVFGVSPGRARLAYECPLTLELRTVTFEPPAGAARPFTIERID